MPEIIKFYTGQNAILKNVETWRCSEKDHLQYVLQNIASLVIKRFMAPVVRNVNRPRGIKKEISLFKVNPWNPSNYIAQPTLSLSTVPILKKSGLTPACDLRPFSCFL